MVDSLIEDHEPGGIGGYDLSQNPRCGAYLGLPAFVLNQAGQYLSPDAVLSVRRDSVLTPTFDCRQAMLESILICGGPLFPFTPAIRALFVARIRFPRRYDGMIAKDTTTGKSLSYLV